jgi:hypothetical protein
MLVALNTVCIGVCLNILVIIRINGLWYVYVTMLGLVSFRGFCCLVFGVSCLQSPSYSFIIRYCG